MSAAAVFRENSGVDAFPLKDQFQSILAWVSSTVGENFDVDPNSPNPEPQFAAIFKDGSILCKLARAVFPECKEAELRSFKDKPRLLFSQLDNIKKFKKVCEKQGIVAEKRLDIISQDITQGTNPVPLLRYLQQIRRATYAGSPLVKRRTSQNLNTLISDPDVTIPTDVGEVSSGRSNVSTTPRRSRPSAPETSSPLARERSSSSRDRSSPPQSCDPAVKALTAALTASGGDPEEEERQRRREERERERRNYEAKLQAEREEREKRREERERERERRRLEGSGGGGGDTDGAGGSASEKTGSSDVDDIEAQVRERERRRSALLRKQRSSIEANRSPTRERALSNSDSSSPSRARPSSLNADSLASLSPLGASSPTYTRHKNLREAAEEEARQAEERLAERKRLRAERAAEAERERKEALAETERKRQQEAEKEKEKEKKQAGSQGNDVDDAADEDDNEDNDDDEASDDSDDEKERRRRERLLKRLEEKKARRRALEEAEAEAAEKRRLEREQKVQERLAEQQRELERLEAERLERRRRREEQRRKLEEAAAAEEAARQEALRLKKEQRRQKREEKKRAEEARLQEEEDRRRRELEERRQAHEAKMQQAREEMERARKQAEADYKRVRDRRLDKSQSVLSPADLRRSEDERLSRDSRLSGMSVAEKARAERAAWKKVQEDAKAKRAAEAAAKDEEREREKREQAEREQKEKEREAARLKKENERRALREQQELARQEEERAAQKRRDDAKQKLSEEEEAKRKLAEAQRAKLQGARGAPLAKSTATPGDDTESDSDEEEPTPSDQEDEESDSDEEEPTKSDQEEDEEEDDDDGDNQDGKAVALTEGEKSLFRAQLAARRKRLEKCQLLAEQLEENATSAIAKLAMQQAVDNAKHLISAAARRKMTEQLHALSISLADLTLFKSAANTVHSKLTKFLASLDAVETDHLLKESAFEQSLGDLLARFSTMVRASASGNALFFASACSGSASVHPFTQLCEELVELSNSHAALTPVSELLPTTVTSWNEAYSSQVLEALSSLKTDESRYVQELLTKHCNATIAPLLGQSRDAWKRTKSQKDRKIDAFFEHLQKSLMQLSVIRPRGEKVHIAEVTDERFPDALSMADLEVLETIRDGPRTRVVKAMYYGELVAIKILKDGSKEGIARFVDELNRLRSLYSGYIHTLYRWSMTASPPVIVTEYLSSGSLHSVLYSANSDTNTPIELPFPTRWRMASHIALALNYLHTRSPSIVHGGLSSRHVVVSEGWRAKLCSLGGHRTGFHPYTDPKTVSKPSGDIHAFGVLLYELAFRDASFLSLDSIQSAAPLTLNPEQFPKELSSLWAKCVKKATSRPTSAQVLKVFRKLGLLENQMNAIREEAASLRKLIAQLAEENSIQARLNGPIEEKATAAERELKKRQEARDEVVERLEQTKFKVVEKSALVSAAEESLATLNAELDKVVSSKNDGESDLKEEETRMRKQLREQIQQLEKESDDFAKMFQEARTLCRKLGNEVVDVESEIQRKERRLAAASRVGAGGGTVRPTRTTTRQRTGSFSRDDNTLF
eukprot:CAMPEP_0174237770 /NCGR_PEP_ID=MMETSP0417-20130205/9341_1 /TAXON_ID=242541 /ORGANISM="Mayorella sp, Strain BSH-02190019" /LENGTH=1553 /DNA_ID=CAMNT_0015316555 /DNA_START=59 /DNA_END=4717 /DNA_ORIENTATION=+